MSSITINQYTYQYYGKYIWIRNKLVLDTTHTIHSIVECCGYVCMQTNVSTIWYEQLEDGRLVLLREE